MAIFMILILLNHKHGMFLICFVLSYFLEQWFVALLEEILHVCIPRYFIVFVAVVNGSLFLIWLSLSLLLV